MSWHASAIGDGAQGIPDGCSGVGSTAGEDVRPMSRRIELSQETEIDAIRRWLRTRGIGFGAR